MNEAPLHLLEIILHQCAQAGQLPWYPSDFALSSGLPRDDLDPFLDRLRLGGYIQLTDWVAGKGQGYRLTPDGAKLVQSPRLLAQLRSGQVPQGRGPADHQFERAPAGIYEARRQALEDAGRHFTDTPHITIGLIIINVAVFMAGFAIAMNENVPPNIYLWNSTPDVLMRTGAVSAPHIVFAHQWWRLLTYCFVHVGLVHLFFNMYALYMIGPLLERLWGPWRFLTLYLIAGFGGGCAAVWETRDIPTAIAGASGALWGSFATWAAWLILNRRVLNSEIAALWRRQLWVFFLINVGITYALPFVSKGGHFGGGIVGFVAAFPMDWLRFGNGVKRLAGALLLVLVPVVCIEALKYTLNADQRGHRPFLAGEALLRRTISVLDYLRLTQSEDAFQIAEQVWDEISALTFQHPSRRKPDKVKEALNVLLLAKVGLEQSAIRLKQLPPGSNAQLKQVSDATRQKITAWMELLSAAQDYLAKGAAATREDESKVEQCLQRRKVADQAWTEAFRNANER